MDLILKNGNPIWKDGKDVAHFKKRLRRNQLPNDFTLDGYNLLIMNILKNDENAMSLHFAPLYDQDYFVIGDGSWIVMYGENAIMETAYPPDNYDVHFNNAKEGFYDLGTVAEVRAE